jgi:hypothetical protein
MLRKVLVYVVLAVLSMDAMGCAGQRTVVRGQSPDGRIDLGRLRRRFRRDIEPVLDATSKVHRRIEPALQVTKDVTRKGLALTGCLALLGGLWWLDQTYDDGGLSTGSGSAPQSASGSGTKERSKDSSDEPRRHEPGD